MKYKEYRTIDKTGWGKGPWIDEPDKCQFADEATGLPCLIVRNSDLGYLCGYVGVHKGHPAFGKHYDAVEANVHGGLTFSGKCDPGPEDHGICHTVEAGEDGNVWWFGFDAAHYRDRSPLYGPPSGAYRTVAYIRDNCRSLAAQLHAMTKENNGTVSVGSRFR